MSATIHFNATVPGSNQNISGHAYLNDNAGNIIREFLDELELAENGSIFEQDGLGYDDIAEFVEAYPEYFNFYDDNDNLKNEEWKDLSIVSFW